MRTFHLCGRHLLVVTAPVVLLFSLAGCYDPLDPGGNITVTFDIHAWTEDGYQARVTIQNYYLYRHVGKPGWKLGWAWAGGEVIWSMAGAMATQQGNCTAFPRRVAHSCRRDPVVVDLPPDAPAESRSVGCCRGGLLAASAIDPSMSASSFELVVGNLAVDAASGVPRAGPPRNLTFMAPGPGYTCGAPQEDSPTVIPVADGRRQEQVFRTWKSACTYSPFRASRALPSCCVSLSAFYNPTVTPCPACSCGCEAAPESAARDCAMAMWCTDHMCPVRVHWHIKNNYRDHWRVKLTVSNFDYLANYSDWNVVVQHPGFRQPPTTFSFNATKLFPAARYLDEVALFWGLENYNKVLLQAGEEEPGSVSTEMLIRKDSEGLFTLRNGWAFPRTVHFNGDSCEMPMPDSFPGLPSAAGHGGARLYFLLLPLLLHLLLCI